MPRGVGRVFLRSVVPLQVLIGVSCDGFGDHA